MVDDAPQAYNRLVLLPGNNLCYEPLEQAVNNSADQVGLKGTNYDEDCYLKNIAENKSSLGNRRRYVVIFICIEQRHFRTVEIRQHSGDQHQNECIREIYIQLFIILSENVYNGRNRQTHCQNYCTNDQIQTPIQAIQCGYFFHVVFHNGLIHGERDCSSDAQFRNRHETDYAQIQRIKSIHLIAAIQDQEALYHDRHYHGD